MQQQIPHQIHDPYILQSKIFEPYQHRIRTGMSLRHLGNMSFQREPPATVLDRRHDFFHRMGIRLEDAVGMDLVHGINVVKVSPQDRGRGATSATTALSATDAMITNDPVVWLLSTHADCAPIFLFDPVKSTVGIAHAGWRGLLAGFIGRIITQLSIHFDTDPADLIVWVGPTIGPCCFEVGKDVADAFRSAYTGEDTVLISKGTPHVNLWRAINADLLREGIPQSSIELPTECTACNSRYGSYRRDKHEAVSMGAVIGLLP
jgi:YfiH family protein